MTAHKIIFSLVSSGKNNLVPFHLQYAKSNKIIFQLLCVCIEMDRSSRPQMFYKIVVLKIFTIFTGKHLFWGKHLRWRFFLINLQSFSPATLSKRDSNTVVFLWILWHFLYSFYPNCSGGCSCTVRTSGSNKNCIFAEQYWNFKSILKSKLKIVSGLVLDPSLQVYYFIMPLAYSI